MSNTRTAMQSKFEFFSRVPADLDTRPCLHESLQHFETTLFLIGLDRIPHAVMSCGAAIKSMLKAYMNKSPLDTVSSGELLSLVREANRSHRPFNKSDMLSFLPPLTEAEPCPASARLLLETGLPYLAECYKGLFGISIEDAGGDLDTQCAHHLASAIKVYQKAKHLPDLDPSYCLLSLAHTVRLEMKQAFLSRWEALALACNDTDPLKWDACCDMKDQLTRKFNLPWAVKCPVCSNLEAFVCDVNSDAIESQAIILDRGACVSCGFNVPEGSPYLLDTLCEEQVAAGKDGILKDYGLAS